MMNRCYGYTKNLQRCSRNGEWRFFCHEHKRQPVIWIFTLIFTILAGSTSIYSVFWGDIKRDLDPQIGQMKVDEKKTNKKTPLSLSAVVDSEHLISFQTSTDVALITILDPSALDHRLRDDKDWWIENSALLTEMNRGNGIFIQTGYDGYFEVLVHGVEPRVNSKKITVNLACSGTVLYVGGFPSDGISLVDNPFGGEFFSCEKDNYSVEITSKDGIIDFTFKKTTDFKRNNFKSVPHLDDF